MNLPLPLRLAALPVAILSAFLALVTAPLAAQTAGAATLSGRVQHSAAGAALENARVTLAGSNRCLHRRIWRVPPDAAAGGRGHGASLLHGPHTADGDGETGGRRDCPS